MAAASSQALTDDPVAQALVAYGAPMASVPARASMGLEDAMLAALSLAHREALVLRSLPVVLARQAERIRWDLLEDGARREGELATLGLVLELAGRFAARPELVERARGFQAEAVRGDRCFFEPRNAYDRRLSQAQSPEVARRWGFWLNLGEEAFRSLFERDG